MSHTVHRDAPSRLHLALGGLSLLALLGLSALASRQHDGGRPALVRAARVFTVASVEPGRYLCTLRDNRQAGDSSLVWQRVLEFARSDLVELHLDPALIHGQRVVKGQNLATLRSLHTEHRLAELLAERQALEAQRSLLLAGGLPAEVEAAQSRVAVAAAEHRAASSELARGRALAVEGLLSELDLEALERDEEVCRLKVERARAEVVVAENPARPEAVAALDSEFDALAAQIAEIQQLAAEKVVRTPLSGLLRVGANGHELEVLDLSEVYVALLVTDSESRYASPGSPICFRSTRGGACEDLSGKVVSLSDDVIVHQGRPARWATAVLYRPGADLLPGQMGTVKLEARATGPTLLAALQLPFGDLQ